MTFACLYLRRMMPDKQVLVDLVTQKMPFGKYKDRLLCQLPVSYLEWFQREGFPPGKLGMQLETLFVIKTNGLEEILNTLYSQHHGKR